MGATAKTPSSGEETADEKTRARRNDERRVSSRTDRVDSSGILMFLVGHVSLSAPLVRRCLPVCSCSHRADRARARPHKLSDRRNSAPRGWHTHQLRVAALSSIFRRECAHSACRWHASRARRPTSCTFQILATLTTVQAQHPTHLGHSSGVLMSYEATLQAHLAF